MAEVSAGNPSSADPWPDNLLAEAVRLRNKGDFHEHLGCCFDKGNATFFDEANTAKPPSGVRFLAAGYHYISLTLDDWFRHVCFGSGAKPDMLRLMPDASLPFIHERTFKHGELPQEANLSTHPGFIKPLVVHWIGNSSVGEQRSGAHVVEERYLFTRTHACQLQQMILDIGKGKGADTRSYHHYVSTTPVHTSIGEYRGSSLPADPDETMILSTRVIIS